MVPKNPYVHCYWNIKIMNKHQNNIQKAVCNSMFGSKIVHSFKGPPNWQLPLTWSIQRDIHWPCFMWNARDGTVADSFVVKSLAPYSTLLSSLCDWKTQFPHNITCICRSNFQLKRAPSSRFLIMSEVRNFFSFLYCWLLEKSRTSKG